MLKGMSELLMASFKGVKMSNDYRKHLIIIYRSGLSKSFDLQGA